MSSWKRSGKTVKLTPYKTKPNLDDDTANTLLQRLRNAFEQIYNADSSSLSFEELYQYAYNLVLYKRGMALYEETRETFRQLTNPLASKLKSTHDSELLLKFLESWKHHKTASNKIKDILMYLDRSVVDQYNEKPVFAIAMEVFNSEVYEAINDRLQNVLLKEISSARETGYLDTRLFKDTIDTLLDLADCPYERDFESTFLVSTKMFYENKGTSLIERTSLSEYISHVNAMLEDELKRADQCLPYRSRKKVQDIVTNALVTKHAARLVDLGSCSEFHRLLQEECVPDLKLLYTLFKQANDRTEWSYPVYPLSAKNRNNEQDNGLSGETEEVFPIEMMSEGHRWCIQHECTALVSEHSKEPLILAQKLIALRMKHERICENSFQGDVRFWRVLKETFELLLAQNTRIVRALAFHTDNFMKEGVQGISDDAIEDSLEQFMKLFRHIADKDLFEEYYLQYLSKRLLSGKSASSEVERALITKMKLECGAQYTIKAEGMFRDLTTSSHLREQYAEQRSKEDNPIGEIMKPTILTQGFWPSMDSRGCNLPGQLESLKMDFEKFYHDRFTGRRLSWATDKGQAEVRAKFASRNHELVVTTNQLCILCLFNWDDCLTFRAIRETLGMDSEELQRQVLSLTSKQCKILLKPRRGADVKDNDEISLNRQFKSKLLRIRVPVIAKVSTEADVSKEMSKTLGSVQHDRTHAIDAALVRVMKTRQEISHSELISEVSHQLVRRFQPKPADIKRRIETLINREYMERDSQNSTNYRYLA